MKEERLNFLKSKIRARRQKEIKKRIEEIKIEEKISDEEAVRNYICFKSSIKCEDCGHLFARKEIDSVLKQLRNFSGYSLGVRICAECQFRSCLHGYTTYLDKSVKYNYDFPEVIDFINSLSPQKKRFFEIFRFSEIAERGKRILNRGFTSYVETCRQCEKTFCVSSGEDERIFNYRERKFCPECHKKNIELKETKRSLKSSWDEEVLTKEIVEVYSVLRKTKKIFKEGIPDFEYIPLLNRGSF